MKKNTIKKPRILAKTDSKAIASFLAKEHQLFLPMLDLIQSCRMAVDELIDVVGRAAIEAILLLSAESVVGEKQQGKANQGAYHWFGCQAGKVVLSDRKLRVSKPRIRQKGKGRGGEVPIPVYQSLQQGGSLGAHIYDLLLRGVTTRNYKHVLREMAETVGVSKSSVSREFVETSAEKLDELMKRDFSQHRLLVIYIDGMVFHDHHVLAAVGVDEGGRKYVLGIQHGASENAEAAKSLLLDLVARGVTAEKPRLFVIDGAKALRKAILEIFGQKVLVQRCRQHKLRNVAGHLPEEIRNQVLSVMRAAYRLPWKEGVARLKTQAEWLQTQYPSAAKSLKEGLMETFTISRLDVSPSLRRSLGSTNLIESPHSGVRRRTRRITKWKNADMVLRWVSGAFQETEKNFRKIMGYRDLWMLRAALDDEENMTRLQSSAA